MIRALLILSLIVALTFAARSFLPPGATLNGSGAALAFGFLLLAAVQTGQAFHALRLPHLTGFILCGAIFGPELLGLITKPMVADLALVKNVAVGLIALTAGCELNFRALRPRLRSIGAYAMTALPCAFVFLWTFFFVATGFLPFTAGFTYRERAAVALVCANALIALSPSVVMGIISETRAAGPLTELALSIVVLADLTVAVTFSLSEGLARGLFPATTTAAAAGGLVWHIFGSLGVGLAVGAVLAVYIKRIGARVGLFIFGVFFVVAEGGAALHLDPLLCGLTAGLFLENVSPVGGQRVIVDTEPASMPIFAVFFAVIGAEIHIRSFLSVAPFGIGAALCRATGMFLGTRAGARFAGGEGRALKNRIPFGLFPQAGIAIALANLIGSRFAGWGEGAGTLLLGTIVVNEMLGPIGWRIALSRAGEIGKKAAHASRGETEPVPKAAAHE
jgi:Kef-type K+ transport system membrane component KefB